MDQTRRRRLEEREWRTILERQEQSGLTVQGFCQREGLKVGSIYRWRRLQKRDGKSQKSLPESVGRDGVPAQFIDVGTFGVGSSRFEVRLDLGGGLCLQIVRS
jgi:transposase-like protein